MNVTHVILSVLTTLALGACAHGKNHADHHTNRPVEHELPKAYEKSSGASASVYVSETSWVNQRGQKMTFNKLRGAPRLMSMVFTRCPSACPLLISDMKRVQNGLDEKRRRQIRFTVFSFDSKHDTPETLRAFAKKMNLDDQWDLLVSDPTSTTEVAALLGIQYKELPGGDFVHSNRLIAFDGDGVTIGEKDGLGGSVDAVTKALAH